MRTRLLNRLGIERVLAHELSSLLPHAVAASHGVHERARVALEEEVDLVAAVAVREGSEALEERHILAWVVPAYLRY